MERNRKVRKGMDGRGKVRKGKEWNGKARSGGEWTGEVCTGMFGIAADWTGVDIMGKKKLSFINRIVSSGKNTKPTELAIKTASKIDKETFLAELFQAWYPTIKVTADIDTEVNKASIRIFKSTYSKIFSIVGIDREDIKRVVTEIIGLKKSITDGNEEKT